MKFNAGRDLLILAAIGAVVAFLYSVGDRSGNDGTPPAAAIMSNDDARKTHVTIANPAELSGARAEEVYQAIRPTLRAAYALSEDSIADAYQGWRRYNSAPYPSTNHGDRFANNYANDLAADYGNYENIGRLPEGALIVKDTFTVTGDGNILVGPFFAMEKMAAGFSPDDGDWRYMMIAPDGELVGLSGGINAAKVAFCAACHRKAAAQDYLYFLPEDVRVK